MIKKLHRIWDCQKYNNQRKPWRKLKWACRERKGRGRFRVLLCLLLCMEAAVFFVSYSGSLQKQIKSLVSFQREEQIVLSPGGRQGGGAQKEKEILERGFSFDWKEGRFRLWQKVERPVTLRESGN